MISSANQNVLQRASRLAPLAFFEGMWDCVACGCSSKSNLGTEYSVFRLCSARVRGIILIHGVLYLHGKIRGSNGLNRKERDLSEST